MNSVGAVALSLSSCAVLKLEAVCIKQKKEKGPNGPTLITQYRCEHPENVEAEKNRKCVTVQILRDHIGHFPKNLYLLSLQTLNILWNLKRSHILLSFYQVNTAHFMSRELDHIYVHMGV